MQPLIGNYRKANLQILAISVDSVRTMKRLLDNMAPGDRYGFPMLSDRKLRVFREWMAYDDFEHMPLHGTYLVDGHGRLRWQDISPRPFNRPKWLLRECSRLLKQKSE